MIEDAFQKGTERGRTEARDPPRRLAECKFGTAARADSVALTRVDTRRLNDIGEAINACDTYDDLIRRVETG